MVKQCLCITGPRRILALTVSCKQAAPLLDCAPVIFERICGMHGTCLRLILHKSMPVHASSCSRHWHVYFATAAPAPIVLAFFRGPSPAPFFPVDLPAFLPSAADMNVRDAHILPGSLCLLADVAQARHANSCRAAN